MCIDKDFVAFVGWWGFRITGGVRETWFGYVFGRESKVGPWVRWKLAYDTIDPIDV